MTSTTFFLVFIPLLAIILLLVNLIFASHNPYKEKNSAFECGFHSFLGQNRTQFSISFFIFALLFLLFDLEILLVYPYIVSAYTNDIYGLVVTLIFFLVLTLGFAFELGKNALKIDSKQLLSVVSKQLYVKAILDINSPPLPHRFVDSVLQSNKSYFFLFTVSSSTITLNISFPNLSSYINTLLDSVHHAAVSNIFTNNTGVTNVIDNNEPDISRLFNNTAIHNSDIINEFVHRGNSIVDPNILHGIFADFTNNTPLIVFVLPLIYPLSVVIQEMTNRLARLARLMQGSALYNSKRIFSFSLVTTRRLNTRICSDLSKIKDKIFIPNWKLKTLNVFRNSKTDYLNSVVNNMDRNFFSYMAPSTVQGQDQDYNIHLLHDYAQNMIEYRAVHARLSDQVRQLNMRYHYHIVHVGSPDPSNPSTMKGIVDTMRNTQELRNNVVSITEELVVLRIHLDHLRERAIERNYYNTRLNGHLVINMIPVLGNQTQLWAIQDDSLNTLIENIGIFFSVVGPLDYIASSPLGSRSRTQDNEQGDNEEGGPSKTRKF